MLSEAEASIPPASVADSSTPLRSAQNDRSIGHSRERGKMNFKTASYLFRCRCLLTNQQKELDPQTRKLKLQRRELEHTRMEWSDE